MENNPQRTYYDGIKEKFRLSSESKYIPKYMKIFLEIEDKNKDYINRLYYAICDYLFLDIEPSKEILKSKEWVLLEDYLDKEKEELVTYGDI